MALDSDNFLTDRSDEYLHYPKLPGLPTSAGRYWHRIEKPIEGILYSIFTVVDWHPEGYPFCNAGRMERMPGDWYGPVK